MQKSLPPEDDTGEDAFDALFENDEDSSELDEDDYGEIDEKDLQRLQLELEEAFGVDGDDDDDAEAADIYFQNYFPKYFLTCQRNHVSDSVSRDMAVTLSYPFWFSLFRPSQWSIRAEHGTDG